MCYCQQKHLTNYMQCNIQRSIREVSDVPQCYADTTSGVE